jgi:DNA-binding IclR family transcriptional regulator
VAVMFSVDPTEHEDLAAHDRVSSVGKAVRLLRGLASADGDDAGISELAMNTGLPKSTTHRVLAELMQEELVARSGKRYRLGPGWFSLQSALSSSEYGHLTDAARRPLAELFESRRSCVHFGVLDGGDVLYLEKLTAQGGTRVATGVGGRRPATCTALGKAMLAHSADAGIISSALANPTRQSARSITVPHLLLGQLGEIRRRGIALDLEECQPGVFCVAAPVMIGAKVVAAVSLTRLDSDDQLASDAPFVRRAAQQITDLLRPLPKWRARA